MCQISCFYHNVHNWALLGGLNSSTTPLITKLSFKITDLKFHPNLKWTNELTHSSQVTLTLWHGSVSQLWFSHLVGVMTAIISTYADSILTRHPGIKFNKIFWEIKISLFRKMHLALSHASNGNRALRVAPYYFFQVQQVLPGTAIIFTFPILVAGRAHGIYVRMNYGCHGPSLSLSLPNDYLGHTEGNCALSSRSYILSYVICGSLYSSCISHVSHIVADLNSTFSARYVDYQ